MIKHWLYSIANGNITTRNRIHDGRQSVANEIDKMYLKVLEW